ncbi:MAG TPA: S-layer homology domain-containing protein [Clostridiales bacterium]|nr:S-layer homology domain-containing protein [Clostridiales bacterium]
MPATKTKKESKSIGLHNKSILHNLLFVILMIFTFTMSSTISSISSAAGISGANTGEDSSGFKFNMTYIHFNDKNSYLKYVENTKDSINEVSPNYLSLKYDGTLQISSTLDKGFIDEMHKRGIKVVPFLSNNWDRTLGRFAMGKRYKLSEQIAEAIEKYNLDGVNIDIEDLTEKDRDRHTDFIRMLRKKIPADKVIAVSVASNPKGITTGWHGSYDYEGLAEYCDYLMIMTYDEHYGGGPSGPVASIGFVERSIEYALKKVPKEKIVLGIPFYGRMWKNGGGFNGQGVSLKEVSSLIARYGGRVSFSNAYLSPKAVVTIKSDDDKPYINGKKLEAGTYTIWYENEDSLKHKLSLVKKYGIKGTGSWSLGQEPSSIWNYYSLWLNGHYYKDVQGHWAQNPIIFALNNGWITTKTVKDSGVFAPDKPLTRAEAAFALVRSLELDKDRKQESKITFSDISNHWAKNEIDIAAQHRIITGRGDGTFGPDDAVSREEMSVMLDRAISGLSGRSTVLASRGMGSGSNMNISYVDVSRELCTWSYDSIIKMSQQGIITGTPDGKFNPKSKISRAETAALLFKVRGHSSLE